MRKDSFSLKFYPAIEKTPVNGEIPIYLRVMVNRKKVEISTKMSFKQEQDWDVITQRVKQNRL